MKRISTDAEYLTDGTVTVDADGIPITISGKADQSVITRATHEVGRADAVRANRLVKLDENGDLFIATNSIIKDSDPVNKVYVDRVVPIPAFAGTGSPEGRVTAPVGTIYTDTAATNGAIRWVKSSGTGTTGWRVEYGDTGWRVLTLDIMPSGGIQIRRINSTVHVFAGSGTYRTFNLSSTSSVSELGVIPVGFRSDVRVNLIPVILNNPKTSVGALEVLNSGNVYTHMSSGYTSTETALQSITTHWATEQAWPTTLPGTPA